MKLSIINRSLSKAFILVAAATMGGMCVSCDSFVYDDQGDCTVHYRVAFRYTKNMLDADAFGSQVTDVNLYLFDKNGRMAFHKKEQRTPTTENLYYMDVDVLPGTYDMIAWCEGKSSIASATSFVIDNADSPSSMQNLDARLPLVTSSGNLISDRDINRLYYGQSRNVVFKDSYGVVNIEPIYLTKDTNHITIQLQNSGKDELDPALFSIALEGRNSELDWQNNVTGDVKFSYVPWSQKSITTSFETEDDPETGMETKAEVEAIANGLQAELTTGRIMANIEQKLTVKRIDTGKTIFSIPLVEYLLLVRGEYEVATSNQDYLDRYDDFSMVFFMQDGDTWIKSRILINGWRVVPPQSGIL